jgi:hypothetical protein
VNNPRFLADASGDGYHDIVGFGGGNVYVARWNNTSGTFDPNASWLSGSFTYNSGWRSSHARFVADVNHDGRADLVGLGTHRGYLAVSTGSGFVRQDPAGTFRSVAFTGYTTTAGWADAEHLRMLGDVTGDGTADLVGFGRYGVYVRDLDD